MCEKGQEAYSSSLIFHKLHITLELHHLGALLLCGSKDMKEYAKGFYKSKAWQECRAAYYKSKQGLCERCLDKGIITAADIVHHKIHITPDNIGNPDITLNWDNLECVCRNHHAEIHTGKVKRFTVDEWGHVTPLC